MKGIVGQSMKLTSFPRKVILGSEKIREMFRFEESEPARLRLKIIEFSKIHGIKATIDAFSVSRRSVFRWRKLLRENSGRLRSLVPNNTRPKRIRRNIIRPEVLEFIRTLREEYGRFGKEKIKPLLDEFCEEKVLDKISISKIGRVIKRYNLNFFHKKKHKVKQRNKNYAKAQPEKSFGFIEIDTITEYINGRRVVTFSAIDIQTKFHFSYSFGTNSSKNAVKFFKILQEIYPDIHTVRTDNGSEFLGEFQEYLEEKQINHEFILPRTPKLNSFIERMNRTLEDEFLKRNIPLAQVSFDELNKKLFDYCIFYNTKRVHWSLKDKETKKLLTPIGFMLQTYPECQKWWTETSFCKKKGIF